MRVLYTNNTLKVSIMLIVLIASALSFTLHKNTIRKVLLPICKVWNWGNWRSGTAFPDHQLVRGGVRQETQAGCSRFCAVDTWLSFPLAPPHFPLWGWGCGHASCSLACILRNRPVPLTYAVRKVKEPNSQFNKPKSGLESTSREFQNPLTESAFLFGYLGGERKLIH